jgi:hypothetical protein
MAVIYRSDRFCITREFGLDILIKTVKGQAGNVTWAIVGSAEDLL